MRTLWPLIIVLLTACAKPAAPPSIIDSQVGAGVAQALQLGAEAAGSIDELADLLQALGADVSSMRTPGVCVASRVTEGVLHSASLGVATAATPQPVIPAIDIDLSGCGLTGAVQAPDQLPFIVDSSRSAVIAALRFGQVNVKDPCGFIYAEGVLEVLAEIVLDVFARDTIDNLRITVDAQPLTGGTCAAI